MNSNNAPAPDSGAQDRDTAVDRARRLAIKRKIVKDARINAKGYILSFHVPAGGE